jgi:hypothetical protein
MKKLTMIVLTLMVMLSACSTSVKKLDLTNVTFVEYYFGSTDPIPSMEWFPLTTNQINPLTPYLDTASWVAVKKPAGTITSDFSLRDFRQRDFSFSLSDDKMLVVIKDNMTTYYYQGDKTDFVALKAAIKGYHEQEFVPDVSDLRLVTAMSEGENTLISDIVSLTSLQSDSVIDLLDFEHWTISEVLVPFDYGYELILKGSLSLNIGFRLEGNQEIAVIRDTLSNDYTVYDVPSGVKQSIKTLVKSYVVTDYPDGNFLDTRFVQSYIGFGEGFGLPVMLPEYIYTLTLVQADQLNALFDLSKWEIMNTIPEIYYYNYGLIDTNGNRFFFIEDGTGMVVEVISADPLVDPVYYSVKSSVPQTVRQLLVDWYVPQPPSAYVRSLDFIKIYSGFEMEGPESQFLYDLTAEQLLEFKTILDYDSWIQSYDIPGMGINATYVIKTTDSIHMIITRSNTEAWLLISDENAEAPQILGYYAPLSVYDAVVDYLNSHTP